MRHGPIFHSILGQRLSSCFMPQPKEKMSIPNDDRERHHADGEHLQADHALDDVLRFRFSEQGGDYERGSIYLEQQLVSAMLSLFVVLEPRGQRRIGRIGHCRSSPVTSTLFWASRRNPRTYALGILAESSSTVRLTGHGRSISAACLPAT